MDVQSPFESALTAFKYGSSIGQAVNQANAQKQKAERAQQMQNDLYNLSVNKSATAGDYANIITRYPEIAEPIKTAFDVLSPEQKQNKINHYLQIYTALTNNKPDIAIDLINRQADAFENSGHQNDADAARSIAETIKINPDSAKTNGALILASVLGQDKFAENLAKIEETQRAEEKAPYELTEAQAKAQKAAVDAKFAESNAAIDLQKKGWDITKIQEDIKISKENNRIAALNAAIAREGNSLKRQEMGLKLEEMKQKRDDAVREKASKALEAFSAIDNSLSTIDRLLKNPELDNVIGSMEGGWFGDYKAFASLGDEKSDAIATIETLGSQVFLSKAKEAGSMVGLTEKEGEKLQQSLVSLTRKQSEKGFRANMDEAKRLLLKSRKLASDKFGIPQTLPDTPEASAAGVGKTTDEMLRELGVMYGYRRTN